MSNYCKNCTTCCQWGGELKTRVTILPMERSEYIMHSDTSMKLKAKENGDCIYLDRKTGCTIHNISPINCKKFNCLELLDTVMQNKNNVFLRTLMEAVRIKSQESSTDHSSNKHKS